MRTTSIRELHIHTSELVREAEGGSVIVIERRGEPVAQLQALSGRPKMAEETRNRILRELCESRAAILAESGAVLPVTTSKVDRIISEDRDRY